MVAGDAVEPCKKLAPLFKSMEMIKRGQKRLLRQIPRRFRTATEPLQKRMNPLLMPFNESGKCGATASNRLSHEVAIAAAIAGGHNCRFVRKHVHFGRPQTVKGSTRFFVRGEPVFRHSMCSARFFLVRPAVPRQCLCPDGVRQRPATVCDYKALSRPKRLPR